MPEPARGEGGRRWTRAAIRAVRGRRSPRSPSRSSARRSASSLRSSSLSSRSHPCRISRHRCCSEISTVRKSRCRCTSSLAAAVVQALNRRGRGVPEQAPYGPRDHRADARSAGHFHAYAAPPVESWLTLHRPLVSRSVEFAGGAGRAVEADFGPVVGLGVVGAIAAPAASVEAAPAPALGAAKHVHAGLRRGLRHFGMSPSSIHRSQLRPQGFHLRRTSGHSRPADGCGSIEGGHGNLRPVTRSATDRPAAVQRLPTGGYFEVRQEAAGFFPLSPENEDLPPAAEAFSRRPTPGRRFFAASADDAYSSAKMGGVEQPAADSAQRSAPPAALPTPPGAGIGNTGSYLQCPSAARAGKRGGRSRLECSAALDVRSEGRLGPTGPVGSAFNRTDAPVGAIRSRPLAGRTRRRRLSTQATEARRAVRVAGSTHRHPVTF